jgi:lysophospholipase L1-like esterase
MTDRGRERLAKAGLVVSSCLVALGLAELIVRVAGLSPPAGPRFVRRVSADRRVGLDLYAENLGGRFDVDLRETETRARYAGMGMSELDALARTTPYGVECRYDARGFRGPALGSKRPDVLRVLVLGDSFTEGQGVREGETYASVLAQLLESSSPGRFEVGNRGHRGWDLPRLHAVLVQLLAERPDVIVYGMVLNDAVRSPEFQARQAYLDDWVLDRSRSSNAEGASWCCGLWSLGLARERIQAWRVGRATTRWYREMYAGENAAGWQATRRYLRDMDRQALSRGAKLAVALWPLLVDLDRAYPFADATQTIAAFAAQKGIPFLDLRDALRGRSTAALWVAPGDRHPNAEAHRLAAQALVPVVRRLTQAIQPPPRQTSPS